LKDRERKIIENKALVIKNMFSASSLIGRTWRKCCL